MLETVNRFISMVEANQHIEAVELVYADNANYTRQSFYQNKK